MYLLLPLRISQSRRSNPELNSTNCSPVFYHARTDLVVLEIFVLLARRGSVFSTCLQWQVAQKISNFKP